MKETKFCGAPANEHEDVIGELQEIEGSDLRRKKELIMHSKFIWLITPLFSGYNRDPYLADRLLSAIIEIGVLLIAVMESKSGILNTPADLNSALDRSVYIGQWASSPNPVLELYNVRIFEFKPRSEFKNKDGKLIIGEYVYGKKE